MDPLIFIDTNILLDFYRIRRGDVGLSLLERFDNHHGEIITGSQVEMEFKRNRQIEIIRQLSDFKKGSSGNSSLPAILSETQLGKTYKKKQKDLEEHEKKIKEKIEKILHDPTHNDLVYRCFQRLFKSNTPYNLNRENTQRYSIRRLARKRFSLGYPPRKPNDTSMGDAVNWEWMINCCLAANKDLVIVSRDTDYGISHGKDVFLNDWLRQEFKERVGRLKKAVLTDKLTVAFRYLNVGITDSEAEEEDYLVKSFVSTTTSSASSPYVLFDESDMDEERLRILRNYWVHRIAGASS